ncbi:hypothetical protein ZWY2020_050723 [Hordeum vulgare]|nr:hypothetical protein ZWY2020_050723 [Hordeum vulgare]
MGPVIRKLGELLVRECNLKKRVKRRPSSLTELEIMHAVLRKVGEVPSDQLEEPVRIWAGKVRDLSCDMEDAVDDFLLADLSKRYDVDMRSTSNGATIDPRVLALHKDVGELVGVDRTRDELIKTLNSEGGSSKEQLKTISIVGVGGLGKTTLTKAIYEKIKAQFQCAAFVPVGQNPDIKKVFKDLLYGLDKQKFSDIHKTTRDENLLIKEIGEFLVDKRYLIVIDDIWEKDIWKYIDCALYKNKLQSRIFPEDYEIQKKWLIWRWIAEGFIQRDKKETSLFEIGERYFNELMNRSLIQPAKINEEGTVVTVHIHDMVLDLICSLSTEENFISILDNVEWHAPNLERKFRRLSLHNINAKVQIHQFDSTNLSKVRTFAVFSPVASDWLPSLSSFQFLRVLDLGNCGSRESSSGISLKYVENLIHLRYLGLANADVQELPLDIGKLQLLQTLDIRGTRIQELPASIVQLTNLICLRVDEDLVLPRGMGNFTSLEVLKSVRLSWSPHIVKELSHLTKVRTFSINCIKMDEGLIDILIKSLGNLQKLHNLRIDNGCRLMARMRESWVPPPLLRSFESWGFFETVWFSILPKWVNSTSLAHLSTLVIDVEELQGDDLQIIGMLPALRFLCLCARRVMGSLVVRADAFPSARCCKFSLFQTSPCLFPPGAMPWVQRLHFRVSARSIASGEVDCGMGHLPSLQHVKVFLERKNSSNDEMETAEAWLKRAAEAHPKRPTIGIVDMPLPPVRA